MTKINKYQKIVLLLYGIAFIYFSIINVPFKIKRGSEIVYDTLFSNRANIDFSRLSLVIIITTLISGILFLVARNLRVNLKLKPIPKPKPTLYILLGIIIIAVSAFLIIKKYGSSFSLNTTAKKIDSISVTVKSDKKIQISLPILDTISHTLPPFLRNKYLYNGETFNFSDVLHAARQSNLDVEVYIKKAGILVIDEEGLPIPKTISKKYKTPNGKIVDESVLRQKYGSRFNELVNDGTFKVYDEIGQVKTVKMIFPDGSFGDINVNDTLDAIKAGAKHY